MQKSRNYYQNILKAKRDYKIMLKNYFSAYLFGGIVAIIGQLFYNLYFYVLKFPNDISSTLMTLSIVLIAGLLTGLGIYDNIGQIAKCGLAIPITGFANASVSSAMEYHKEGIVLGIGANTLKLAGSVIVLGSSSAIIVAFIRYIFEVVL